MFGKYPLAMAGLTLFLAASAGDAATVSWTLPSTYMNGSPIGQSDVVKITVNVYEGPSKTGPWKLIAASRPGATSVVIPDPPRGRPSWYVLNATLGNETSDFSEPVIKTGLLPPIVYKIAEKTFTRKKVAFLISILSICGIVFLIRYAVKRRQV
jgi:hypothetical protein